MKKALWIVLLPIIGLIGYVATGPFLTVQAIRSSLVDQDAEALARNVDFPVLRQNLKEQFNAQMMQKAGTDLKGNPFNRLAMGFASRMTDGLVDTLVTPAGLARLMEGKKLTQNRPVTPEERAERKEKLLKNARYTFDSIDRFSVWVQNDQGEELRLVLARDGLSWTLINLIVPMDR